MHTIQFPLLLALAALLPCAASAQENAPPARELLLGLTAESRLAGTSGSLRAARFVAGVLERAGWRVQIDQRVVLLSLPRRIDFSIFADEQSSTAIVERHERFDPDAIPAGDVPMYCAYSASGVVRGPVVDAGQGLRADFERLVVSGVELQGCVALVRYGGSYRGIKVDLATEFGCAAVLLFTPADVDGGGRGLTWPAGPWKPDTLAQCGSISPMGRAPGDPSTPGFASPAPGVKVARLGARELALQLPRIPAIPIGSREAHLLLDGLRRPTPKSGVSATERSGPGPIEVELGVDAPRDLRTIYNVIATLDGHDQKLVIAGNHRDAWMRGANDAGSGSVALMRAAQQLGERARAGNVCSTLCCWAFGTRKNSG
jgi:N-acetylated-alpha-linked acidic dipeptidase